MSVQYFREISYQFVESSSSVIAVTDNKKYLSEIRCSINVQSGAALKPRDDTMLQVDIRPQENAIVRNHLLNLVSGAEERYGGNPIQAHQSFEIAITAEHSQYRITINGQHFCTFTHRLPLTQARYVSISGTCTISHILIENVGSFAPTQPIYPPIATPAHPRFPIHHHPPAPPPMPHPIAPPPYPGLYPGHQHPAPYTVFKHELEYKLNHLKHHDGGPPHRHF